MAEVVERFDADRHGEQRARAQAFGGCRRGAHRHLHQGISAALSSSAQDAIAEVREAHLFTQAVQLGLEDLPAQRVQHAVDGDGASPRSRHRQMASLTHSVGVSVGGGKVGTLLPILDTAAGDPEERGATQVDE